MTDQGTAQEVPAVTSDRVHRTTAPTLPLAPDDPRHGTLNGYTQLRCRCDRCRAAKLDYQREYRRKQAQRPDSKHSQRELRRAYEQRPEVQQRKHELLLEKQREYQQRPDVKEKRREYQREYSKQRWRNRPKLALDDPRHGTWTGYSNWGCRCDPCREAGHEYQREYSKRPEVRDASRVYQRQYKRESYHRRPAVRERVLEYQRDYRNRPGVRERVLEKKREYTRARRHCCEDCGAPLAIEYTLCGACEENREREGAP